MDFRKLKHVRLLIERGRGAGRRWSAVARSEVSLSGDPSNVLSVPVLWGWDYEEPDPVSPTCSLDDVFEGQVARAYWDLDDAANELAGFVDKDSDGRDDPVDVNGDGNTDDDLSNLDDSKHRGWV